MDQSKSDETTIPVTVPVPIFIQYQEELEKRNVKTIGIELRHSRTLGGGHHCVTLDLERE